MDPVRLRQTLAVPTPDWLIRRLRARMERGEPLEGSVSLAEASPEQRDAVARLLGSKPTRAAGSMRSRYSTSCWPLWRHRMDDSSMDQNCSR